MKPIFQTATKNGDFFITLYHVADHIGKVTISDADMKELYNKDITMLYEDNPSMKEVSEFLTEAFDYIKDYKREQKR